MKNEKIQSNPQLEKLQALLKIANEKHVTPEELKEFVRVVTTTVKTLKEKMKDGDPGKKGDKGDEGKPGKSIKGNKGDKGDDGYTPVKGKDYFDGEKGDKGDIGDLRDLSPHEIRNALELLFEDERLDARYIKGLPVWDKAPMMHTPSILNLPDVQAVGISIGQTLVWNGVYFAPGNSGSGGSSGFQQATGTVNGTNKVFTFSVAPTAIIVDGATLQQTEQGGTINWTGTTNVTLAVAPTQSIFGVGTAASSFQIPTGTVNGTNNTFVFATAPQAICVDGAVLQQTEQGGTVNWTGTTTVILTVAPTESVFGVA